MSYEQLLTWLAIGRLEEAHPAQVLELVEAALDDMAEDDPLFEALLDIEDALLDGKVPAKLLRALLPAGASAEPDHHDDVERLDREYRAIAAAYPPPQWRSNFYLELERLLDDPDEDSLLHRADALRSRIAQAWERYSADYSSLATRSAETVVGHRLMKEGYEGWMRALDLVESDAEDEEILAAAETAVRLLVAVGQLDRDVKMQAGSMERGSTYQKGY